MTPVPGYAPTVGALVAMLTYTRATTIAAVADLGPTELDHQHDESANPIGALLALAVFASPASGESAAALRVVTFNLLHGGPSSGLSGDDQHLDDRLAMVARELRGFDPDIVGLQESSISRGRNVAARLAGALGLHWAHASASQRLYASKQAFL